MEFDQILRICKFALSRHWMMIVAVTVLSVATAVGLTYVIPEKYESSAIVLLLPQERLGLTTANSKEMLELPASGSTLHVETPSRTYIEIIKSRAVAAKVVRRLGLEAKYADVEPTGLIPKLKYHLKSFLSTARDVLKYGRAIETTPFERATRAVRKNLSLVAVRNTFVFRIAYRSVDPQRAADIVNAAVDVFREIHDKAMLLDARQNRQFVSKRLAEVEGALNQSREAVRNFKQQNTMVAFAEQRTESIKSISRLAAEIDKVRAELSALESEFADGTEHIVRDRAKIKLLRENLAREQAALSRLPEQEMKLASLELRTRTLTSAYEALKRELEDAELREGKTMNEIRVMSPAVPATHPSSPIKLYYGAAALFLGCLVGFGMALLAEITDTRLITVEDVETALRLPVLTTAPKISAVQ